MHYGRNTFFYPPPDMPPSPIASENSTGSSGDFELRKQTPAERERRLEDLKFHLRVFELYKQPALRSLLTQYRFLLEGELLSEELKNEILTEIVPTRQCREFITQEVFRAGATRFEDDVTWRLRTLLKLAPVEGQAGRVLIDVLLGIIRELNAKENRTAPWFIELQRHVHCWPVNLPMKHRRHLKTASINLIQQHYGVNVRRDLKDETGKYQHGFKNLSVNRSWSLVDVADSASELVSTAAVATARTEPAVCLN